MVGTCFHLANLGVAAHSETGPSTRRVKAPKSGRYVPVTAVNYRNNQGRYWKMLRLQGEGGRRHVEALSQAPCGAGVLGFPRSCPDQDGCEASVLLYDLVLERYGNYVVVFDADRDQVPVFTKHGKWVGEATKPSCPTRSSPASSTCAAPAANQWLALFGLPSRVEPKLIELAPARGWAQQDDDTWSCDEPPK